MNTNSRETETGTGTLSPPHPRLSGRCIVWFYWGAISVLLAVYCGRAINDPDFWWHLKSGEVMLNQGGILDTDPFNYTGDMVVHRREAVILKGYWLWQVTAALFYRMSGIYGIFLFKLMTLLLMTGAVFREMRRQAVSPFVHQILIGLGALVIVGGYEGFSLERPQIYSFILCAVLLGMVAQVRLGRRPSWMLIPLMIVWSNIHGGFVVGDILLALFAAGVVIQYRKDHAYLGLLLCWAIAGIVASLANPNGWNAVIESFSIIQQNTLEQLEEYKNSSI